MRIIFKIITIIIIGLNLIGGNISNSDKAIELVEIENKNYKTIDGLFQFTFPADWIEDTTRYNTSAGELRMESPEEYYYFLALTYEQINISDDLTHEEIFQFQIEDFESKRKNWKMIEDTKVIEIGDKSIKSVVYSGDLDYNKNYYKISLIEFNNNDDYFVITVQIGVPSEWERMEYKFDEILASTKCLK